jgi:hypothetical protein
VVGMGRAQVPYWLGQTFVAARRTKSILLAVGMALSEFAEVHVVL